MAGGGGAWKVAYADFVTAMMALFLVLWLTAQSPEIKHSVARAFTSPFASPDEPKTGFLTSSEDDNDSQEDNGSFAMGAVVQMNVLRRLSQQILESLHSTQSEDLSSIIQMRVDGENLRINVFDRPSHAIFQPGTTELTEFGRFIFTTLAWQVTNYPRALLVELEGHALKSEAGPSTGGVWDLSLDRADAIRSLMVEYRVPPERIRKVSGFGDSQPFNALDPDDPSNRRVGVMLRLKSSD